MVWLLTYNSFDSLNIRHLGPHAAPEPSGVGYLIAIVLAKYDGVWAMIRGFTGGLRHTHLVLGVLYHKLSPAVGRNQERNENERR